MKYVQSKLWHMNMTLEEIVKLNLECKVDRNYKAHKSDDCFNGYCIYVKHPEDTSDIARTMIGITRDGFTYLGDGAPDKDYPMENISEVLEEMYLYRDWLLKKEDNEINGKYYLI